MQCTVRPYTFRLREIPLLLLLVVALTVSRVTGFVGIADSRFAGVAVAIRCHRGHRRGVDGQVQYRGTARKIVVMKTEPETVSLS